MKIEDTLKSYIIERYRSVRAFANTNRIPYTTVVSALKRGIDNSSVTTIVRICDALNLSSDSLMEGRIVVKSDMFDTTEPVLDLNDLVASYKWTFKNNPIKYNGQLLTENDIKTLLTGIDIGIEMIKKNTDPNN